MSCFIRECKSGRLSERRKNKEAGIKNCSFFSARNDEMLHAWRKAIPRKDRLFEKKDRICELHFTEADVDKDYVSHMPDGTVVRIPKGRVTLKMNAVPSIFCQKILMRKQKLFSYEDKDQNSDQNRVTNIKNYSTKQSVVSNTCDQPLIPKIEYVELNRSNSEEVAFNNPISDPLHIPRLLPSEHSVISIKQEERVIPDVFPLDNQADFEEHEQKPTVELLFSTIVNSYKSISVPSELWLSCFAYGCVMWTSWKKDLSAVENQIVISPDMNVQVSIEEREVKLRSMAKIESINDVAELLQKVTRLVPCEGAASDKRVKNCAGYVLQKNQNRTDPKEKKCIACQKHHKATLKKFSKFEPLKIQQPKIFAVQRQYRNMRRQRDHDSKTRLEDKN